MLTLKELKQYDLFKYIPNPLIKDMIERAKG